uniref:Dipeptidylpeptidase IV N-terminal domain-containing protein n=1 Tax=Fundulus heteroclitus TaxID=8078 RepID=A0A3Q2Q0P8_FUNHE
NTSSLHTGGGGGGVDSIRFHIFSDLSWSPPTWNWKGIGISLLVIAIILSFIGLSIVLILNRGPGNTSGSPLTLDDLFQRNFQIHDPEAKWISGEFVLFRSGDGDVFKVNVEDNQTELLLKNTTFATFKATKFAVSPDKNFVLLGYDVQVFLLQFALQREIRCPLSVPQIYIFENNIYYQTHTQSSSWRLTSSGQEGVVFNGIADWLYEEQVLGSQVTHWWAPDGSRLAYLTINDSLVPSMLLPRFTGALYPRGTEYPYPKVGLFRFCLLLCLCSDFYITMVKWVTRQNLSVRWVNRAQNLSILSLCDVSTGACVKKHVMTSEAWLDRQNQEPLFSRDCTTFFISAALLDGGGAFSHVAMVSLQVSPGDVQQLTSGGWEVSRLLGWDESTVEPFHRECLSCSLFQPNCSFYDAVLSPDHRHVLLSCRGRERFLLSFTTRSSMFTRLCNFLLNMFVHRDSAPGGQAVSGRFSLGWESVLVSSDRVVVARLDGRGSSFQGQKILQAVHQNLGRVDVQDQITAYGGFLSSLLLLSHSSVIKCGVAVAPVTNWRLYDFYFRLNRVITNEMNECCGVILFNDLSATVHFQHSAELVQLLSALNINYTLQIFPDEGHDIISIKSQRYMQNSVLSFFRRCFEEETAVVMETSKEDD